MSENVEAVADGTGPEEAGGWGGTGYVRREIDPRRVAWWQQLPEATRAALAALRPGDLLTREAATALTGVGLPCPEVVVTEGGRRVRRSVASRDVISSVLQVRLNHFERRLV